MTRQDFQLIATIVDDAARNLTDLFNERIETQPKSFFQAAPVNPVTYEEVKKLLASLIADGFEGKWKFDREKFMDACKIQERR